MQPERMLYSKQKNFLILTAEEKKPLMDFQDAHVIEVMSICKLQQHMIYKSGSQTQT